MVATNPNIPVCLDAPGGTRLVSLRLTQAAYDTFPIPSAPSVPPLAQPPQRTERRTRSRVFVSIVRAWVRLTLRPARSKVLATRLR